MTNKRIVYTRLSDGGVTVCWPTDEAISWMGSGGLWRDKPRGFADIQIEGMIKRGIAKDAAVRFAKAVQFGGCTTAEALEIIRDRSCAHLGTAIELWDWSDIPDRWFRDAWRRSHNGGPISIDLEKARPIHWRRLRNAYTERLNDLTFSEIDLEPFRDKILMAKDQIALRHIWPQQLPTK